MQILVQSDFKRFISSSVKVLDNEPLDADYSCIVGRQQIYQKILDQGLKDLKLIPHKLLIVNSRETISVELYNKINPTVVLTEDNTAEISKKINEAQLSDHQEEQARLARENVESKRTELEKLNEFLFYQDKERSTALKIFHQEEQIKRQHEKMLLFFLDFINSNYAKSSFLDELLQYLWKEIKKIGSFYQLGIIIKWEGDDRSILFQYDDRKYYSQRNITLLDQPISDSAQMMRLLADLYQRPVGKILFWKQTNGSAASKVQFYFYLENQGKEHSAQAVGSFITDRLSLLSLIISRWITEESEKSLLRQWRNTFKSYRDPIHVVDEEFNIIQANYISIGNMEGHTSGKCFEVLAHRQTQCLNCPLRQLQTSMVHNSMVEIVDNQEIRQYQVHASAFTVPSASQDLIPKKYYLLFYENMTEMNKLKSQVIQSEKMNTIGNLANHLAHELNNPLTGLKLTAEYLMSEIKNHPVDAGSINLMNDLNEVFKATTRSEMIIKDLVDFSSDTSKEMQQIDFSVVLKKTMTLLKSALRSTRVFIDVKSHFIHAQPVYLQQIIFNLIKNSCEALREANTTQGSVKIYQDTHLKEYSDFIIEDNGPGIRSDLQADLFKPFFTTKQEGEGTGLGLYLCWTLMKKMNGDLIYDNQFKNGTRFILRFKNPAGNMNE